MSVESFMTHPLLFDAHLEGLGMVSKGRMFAGVNGRLGDAVRDGEVDYQALREAVEWQIGKGHPSSARSVRQGMPTLSHDEHERVIAAVVEQAAGRQGDGWHGLERDVGSNPPDQVAAKAGADAALLVSPITTGRPRRGSTPTSQDCRELRLAQVVYNVPSRTGRNVEAETIERLAEIAPIVAVKEASGSLDQVSDLVARTNLTILSVTTV